MRTKTSKVESQEDKENLRNTRKTLKVLQQTATDKENLAGRTIIDKDAKLASTSERIKPRQVEDKGVQTGEALITAEDLTSEEPGTAYWKRLAEKRQVLLDESFKEIETLKDTVEALEEENKICKEMLEESRNLVEVLQEMLSDENTEVAEEATEESH